MNIFSKSILSIALAAVTVESAHATSLCGHNLDNLAYNEIEVATGYHGAALHSNGIGSVLAVWMDVYNTTPASSISANTSVICYPQEGKVAAVLLDANGKPIHAYIFEL